MHRGQTAAIRESRTPDTGDAVGNGDRCQFAANIESVSSDAGNAVINRDGCNGTAIGIPRSIRFTAIIGITLHCSGA